MRRTIQVIAAGFAVLVVAISSIQTAGGQDSVDPGTPGPSAQVIEVAPDRFRGELAPTIDPEDSAVAMYAEDFGLTREQALHNLELQGVLERLQEKLIVGLSETFVAIELTNDAAGTVRIHATDLATARAVVDRYIALDGAPANFEFVESAYSAVDYRAALERSSKQAGSRR